MWQCRKYQLDTSRPLIMGILNVTPDSFSDGGEFIDVQSAIARGRQMIAQGADIIDVGGESTRPGAGDVSVEQEIMRVHQVVLALHDAGAVVSIDTRHPEVARTCVMSGASIINDISGFCDPAMQKLATEWNAGLIVMHMQGKPTNMQEAPEYGDVVREVSDFLLARAQMLEAAGVAHERIAIDPGPGFGKSFEHNLALLNATPKLAKLGYPLVAAWSRKRFIGELGGGIDRPKDRDALSAEIAVRLAQDGAKILRVHNVAATKMALDAKPKRAIIALGANMGFARGTVDTAIDAVSMLGGVNLLRQSRIYQTEPAYLKDQPVFANAVVQVSTILKPKQLLHALQSLENDFGRVRLQKNGPRTLDLDIIDYEGVCSTDPELLLPHPLAMERDFVVTPLLEIAADYVLADGTVVSRDRLSTGWVQGEAARDSAAETAPSASAATESEGMLSICATPIGNLGDITKRVEETLRSADLILCEDTRVTRKLLNHLGIHAKTERCDENTIRSIAPRITTQIQSGSHIALVSDAGTPGIADPGSVLINAAQNAGCKVEVLPGASAAITALVASGLASAGNSAFHFGGFMPRKKAQIDATLQNLAKLEATLVFFESPHRTLSTLKVVAEQLSNREVVVARELTKLHEEVLRATPAKLIEHLAAAEAAGKPLKGEVVIVIAPPPKQTQKRVHVDRYAKS